MCVIPFLQFYNIYNSDINVLTPLGFVTLGVGSQNRFLAGEHSTTNGIIRIVQINVLKCIVS